MNRVPVAVPDSAGRNVARYLPAIFAVFACFVIVVTFLTLKKPKAPKLVTISYCADICTSSPTYEVYDGVFSEQKCERLKGRSIMDEVKGEFIGCAPK